MTSTNMPLYEIKTQYQLAVSKLHSEDEISDELVAELNQLEGALEDKAIAVAYVLKELESEAASVKEAIKPMQDRMKRCETKIEWLKDYLRNNLEQCGITEIKKSPHFVIKIRTNPVSVCIAESAEVPKEFINEKLVLSVDKLRIKDYLQQGNELLGISLVQTTRVEIK